MTFRSRNGVTRSVKKRPVTESNEDNEYFYNFALYTLRVSKLLKNPLQTVTRYQTTIRVFN